ncbi:MAG TPA: hypothetical protein VJR25_07775 [Microbacterium sp.]|uniref:hypothetical protein n=1 Tax=Microbacterium sp. TaxID=51671 RepID=UPI002B495D4C|nr:hypothetical protein [Microbacterium sp.]HKT56655.1 hypothetical protein [Microbacterium sp.]
MPKSREHGQGALYWVESRKMWRAVLDVGFDPVTGKRLQKARMSKTKDGAVKKLNLMLRERDTQGTVLDRSTHTSRTSRHPGWPTRRRARSRTRWRATGPT